MELLLEGFATILQPQNLLLIFVAVVLGIMFGAIPGLSAFTALVIMFPITYSMAPMIGVSFLVNVYIGACSGGLIAAVLLGIPGTPSSIATCFDGFPMAKRGESGKALGVCILYSFLGGTFGGIALVFLGPIIARFALNFGPYEYFAVILFALTTISSLSEGSIVKGLLSCLLGISVSFAGIDILGAYTRYTFGFSSLAVGFSMVPILIGCFAGSQILESAAQSRTKARISMQTKPAKIRGFGISRKDFIRQAPNSLISALIGLVIGILPGIGGNISNLIAYSFSKKRSKYPEKYGTGIIDGLIASETANNATIAGALIILMTLGIPGDNATSMILAGFQLHGITPGPLLFKTSANLV
jgi:putative tricarboxylic transport membrane protein